MRNTYEKCMRDMIGRETFNLTGKGKLVFER